MIFTFLIEFYPVATFDTSAAVTLRIFKIPTETVKTLCRKDCCFGFKPAIFKQHFETETMFSRGQDLSRCSELNRCGSAWAVSNLTAEKYSLCLRTYACVPAAAFALADSWRVSHISVDFRARIINFGGSHTFKKSAISILNKPTCINVDEQPQMLAIWSWVLLLSLMKRFGPFTDG